MKPDSDLFPILGNPSHVLRGNGTAPGRGIRQSRDPPPSGAGDSHRGCSHSCLDRGCPGAGSTDTGYPYRGLSLRFQSRADQGQSRRSPAVYLFDPRYRPELLLSRTTIFTSPSLQATGWCRLQRLSRPDDPPALMETVEIVAGLPGWQGWLVSKSQFRNHTYNGPLHGTERGNSSSAPISCSTELWGCWARFRSPDCWWLAAAPPPAPIAARSTCSDGFPG